MPNYPMTPKPPTKRAAALGEARMTDEERAVIDAAVTLRRLRDTVPYGGLGWAEAESALMIAVDAMEDQDSYCALHGERQPCSQHKWASWPNAEARR